jgi:hypothetical protein
MTKKRMEDMIHEALEGGRGITEAKGHDQKIIVTLMILKGSLRYVSFLHTYLVVAKTNIKFSEVLSTTQLIQEIINERNGELVLDGELIEGTNIRTHEPSTLFLKYHDHRGRIRDGIGEDNTCLEQFLHYSLNFILLGKGGDDKGEHWEEDYHEQGEWNDHEHHEKEEIHEGWKKKLDVWK